MSSTYFRVWYSPAADGSWKFVSSFGCSPGQPDNISGAGCTNDQLRAKLKEGTDFLEVTTGPRMDAPYSLPADFKGTKRWPIYDPSKRRP